jgi:hypothetical protein
MKNIQFNVQDRWQDRFILALMKFFHSNISENESDEEGLDFRKFDAETRQATEEAAEWLKNKDYSKFKTHSEVFK